MSPLSQYKKIGSEKAERKLVKELTLGKDFVTYLDSKGIKQNSICAQKVAYLGKSKSKVMFELHNGACEKNTLLNSPIVVLAWHYTSEAGGEFRNSEFNLGSEVIGDSEFGSDTVRSLCSSGFLSRCSLEILENKVVMQVK